MARGGNIPTDTVEIIGRELMPRDAYYESMNEYSQQELDKIKK